VLAIEAVRKTALVPSRAPTNAMGAKNDNVGVCDGELGHRDLRTIDAPRGRGAMAGVN
jgi:hypothetical protein